MKPKVDITEAKGERWTMGRLVSDALGEGTVEQNRFLSEFNAVATEKNNDEDVILVLMMHADLVFEGEGIPSEESATAGALHTSYSGGDEIMTSGNHEAHEERGLMYLDAIQALVIENSEDYEQAVGVLADVKAVLFEMDAERKQITEGARKTVKMLNDKYRPALTLYGEAETILKDKLVGFRADIDSIRSKFLAAGEDPPEPVPEVDGLTVREKWSFDIDFEKLPRKFMEPNMRAIEATVKLGESIPGVIAEKVETIVVEHKKVKR